MATPLPPEVLPPDYEALGGIGGLLTPGEGYIPNIQSAYSSIIQNAPDYQYFTAPLSNKGNTTASYGTGNNLVVAPDTPIRVVDNATGKVVYSGTGYEGAQAAIDAATALSSSGGKTANWDIQVAAPGSKTFESVSTERPDVNKLGILADVALPVAGSLLAGPLGLGALGLGAAGTAAAGAAIGSGLSSAAQGRSLSDALLRAAIAGGGSYLGSQLFAPGASGATGATVGENLPSFGILAQPYVNAATNAAGSVVGSVAGSVPSSISDIVVTALGGVPATVGGAFGSLATSLVPSAFDSAQFSDTGPTTNATSQDQPSDWTVTARVNPPTPPITPPLVVPPTTPPTTPVNPSEDLVVTAKDTKLPPVAPPIVIPPGVIPPGTTPSSSTSSDSSSTTDKNKGVLGTGLDAKQILTLLGLGSTLLDSLAGSGGGSTSTTPYVSPFGPGSGVNFGTGTAVDYRAAPTNIDYERYGFGPEAAFFRPEYSRVIGGVAPATSTSPTDIAQIYKPLI